MKRLILAAIFIIIVLALPYLRANAQAPQPSDCEAFLAVLNADLITYEQTINNSDFDIVLDIIRLSEWGYILKSKYELAPLVCDLEDHEIVVNFWSKNNELLFWFLARLIDTDNEFITSEAIPLTMQQLTDLSISVDKIRSKEPKTDLTPKPINDML